MPKDNEVALSAMKHGYKFVVNFRGVWGMGVDDYYCRTRKEAKEAVKEFRKQGFSHMQIEDLEAIYPDQK